MCSSCTGHLPHCTRGFFRTTKLTDLGTPALFLTLLVAISKQPAVSYLCLILFEGTSSAGAFWGKGSKHYEEKSHSLFLQSTWFWTHKFRQQPEIDSSVFWPARGRSFRCLWGRLALTALRGCLFLQVSSMLSLLLSTPCLHAQEPAFSLNSERPQHGQPALLGSQKPVCHHVRGSFGFYSPLWPQSILRQIS